MGIETALTAAIIGAGAASGAAGGRGGSAEQTTTTRVEEDPRFDPLKDLAIRLAQQGVTGDILPEGFAERGVASINQTAGLARQALQARLARRGLSGSPVEGSALGNLARGRAGQISSFLTNVPLVEDQLRNRNFQNLLATLAQRTAGTTSISSGSSSGNVLGGALGGAFGGLGLLAGVGGPSAFSNLFSREEFKEGIEPADIERALEEVLETPLYEWEYKPEFLKAVGGEGEEGRRRLGIIIQKASSDLSTRDDLMQDIPQTVNKLFGAIQALAMKVDGKAGTRELSEALQGA